MKKNVSASIATVALMCVCMLFMLFYPGCKKSDEDKQEALAGTSWVLQAIEYSAQNVIQIQEIFSIVFNGDGTITMEVDCNNCSGTYVSSTDGTLSFAAEMSCTEVACEPNSRDAEFHAALQSASRYEINGNSLLIFFGNEQSTLKFTRQ